MDRLERLQKERRESESKTTDDDVAERLARLKGATGERGEAAKNTPFYKVRFFLENIF